MPNVPLLRDAFTLVGAKSILESLNSLGLVVQSGSGSASCLPFLPPPSLPHLPLPSNLPSLSPSPLLFLPHSFSPSPSLHLPAGLDQYPAGSCVQGSGSSSCRRHFGVYLLHKALQAYLIDPHSRSTRTISESECYTSFCNSMHLCNRFGTACFSL